MRGIKMKLICKIWLSAFFIIFLPLISHAELDWETGIKVNSVIYSTHSPSERYLIIIQTDNQLTPCTNASGWFYFHIEDPGAKYMYTNLLTAQTTGRDVYLLLDQDDPQCIGNSTRIQGVWLR